MTSLRHVRLPFVVALGALAPQLVSAQQRETAREFSCESLPAGVTEADLKEQFGADSVVSEPLVGADDGPQEGTVVFPDDDTMRLEIFWQDPEDKTKAAAVRVRGEGTLWQSPDGFSVGTSLKEIEARNGWPFRMREFRDEGYPGRIVSWGRGNLTNPDSGSCAAMIYLFWPSDAEVDPTLATQIGRGEYSSGHPAMQAIDPVVYQLILYYRWR